MLNSLRFGALHFLRESELKPQEIKNLDRLLGISETPSEKDPRFFYGHDGIKKVVVKDNYTTGNILVYNTQASGEPVIIGRSIDDEFVGVVANLKSKPSSYVVDYGHTKTHHDGSDIFPLGPLA